MRTYKHIFGPVPSRRFGRSLGIDLTPMKTCSFDCVFCQIGRTPRTTFERREYVPVAAVIEELDDWLKNSGKADYLTLAGSGEPTLNTGFGDVIEFLRGHSDIPCVLLTNGTTLQLPEVRKDAARANVVKISLSAFDQDSLQKINRPSPEVRFEQLVEGMKAFRKEFGGKIWLEVFVIDGVNSSLDQARRIAELAKGIGPDVIHLNTAVRPPADQSVGSVSRERLDEIAMLFTPRAEVIAAFKGRNEKVKADADMIFNMLKRRPCTAAQLVEVFSMHPNEVSKYLGILINGGRIRRMDEKEGGDYYAAR